MFIVLFLMVGMASAYLYYNNKYVNFKDKYIRETVLSTLDPKKDKVLKTEAGEIEFLLVQDINFHSISTLEDLKNVPNLKLFASYGGPTLGREETEDEYERYQQMIKDTFPYLKNLKKIFFDSMVIFYDLNALSDCNQVEELWIEENQLKDISNIEGMENLRILSLTQNPFTDISSLEGLKNLEALDLTGVSIENIEPLLKIPSLKLVFYSAMNEEQEKVLKILEENGVEVVQNNGGHQVNFFDKLQELEIRYIDVDDLNKK